MSESFQEHVERLVNMANDSGETWDLSVNDQSAIKAVLLTMSVLRAALVGLVGSDGKDELEQMEAVIRLMPAPAADKAATVDAIHALLSTLAPTRPSGVG